MAKIPYYGLSRGSIGQVRLEPIEDRYVGLKQGINTLQKFVDQRDAVEASKLLAEARSTWNIRLNDLQKEKGLDAEGFSTMVEQQMIDYESEIMSRVPYSQRDKFSAQFAGVKYDVLTKSSLYEADALSKKMVNGVSETLEYNANSILSDFTQRQKITDDTDDLIDDLDIADSVKDELKKEARSKYALSEIKALTELDANALLYNLNSGLYDRDITSQQKAAALSQANNKIQENENELKRNTLEELNTTYRDDYLSILTGDVSRIDLEEMISKPIYASDPEKINKLKNAYDKRLNDKNNSMQTAISLQSGRLMNPDSSQKKAINYAYDDVTRETTDFSARVEIADNYIKLTSGYAPSGFVGELYNMTNSPNPDDRKVAYNTFYELRRKYPNLSSSLSDEKADEMFVKGAALNAGMSLPKIDEQIKMSYDAKVNEIREEKLKGLLKEEIDFDLDANDEVAKIEARRIFSSTYKLIGDEKVARELAENVVNSKYGDTMVGTGSILGTFAKKKSMYMPPEKVYKRGDDSLYETSKWQREELMMDLAEEYPNIKYDDITIDNVLNYDDKGNIIYSVLDKKGVPLFTWRPDFVDYQRKKFLLDKKKKEEFTKVVLENR